MRKAIISLQVCAAMLAEFHFVPLGQYCPTNNALPSIPVASCATPFVFFKMISILLIYKIMVHVNNAWSTPYQYDIRIWNRAGEVP